MATQATVKVDFEANVAKFTVDLDKAKKGIDGIKRSTDSMSESLNTIKFTSLVYLAEKAFHAGQQMYNFGKSIAEAANDIERMSKTIGISTTEWQKFSFAAKMSDVSNETLMRGMKGLSQSMEEFNKKSGDGYQILTALGLSTIDASGKQKTLTQMFKEVATEFSKYETGARMVDYANRLLGKSGMDLIPMFEKGGKGIDEHGEKLVKMGSLIGEVSLKAGSAADNQFKELETRFNSMKISLGPLVLDFVNLATAIIDVGNAIKNSPIFSSKGRPTGEELAYENAKKFLEYYKGMGGPPGKIKELDKQIRDYEEKISRGVIHAGPVTIEKMPLPPLPTGKPIEEYFPKMPPDMWDMMKDAPGWIGLITTRWEETYEPIHNAKGEIVALGLVLKEVQETSGEWVSDIEKRMKIQADNLKFLIDQSVKGPEIEDLMIPGGEVWSKFYEDDMQKTQERWDFKEAALKAYMADEQQAIVENGQAMSKFYQDEENKTQEHWDKQQEIIKREIERTRDFWANTIEEMGRGALGSFFDYAKSGFKDLEGSVTSFGNRALSIIERLVQNMILFGNLTGQPSIGGGYGGLIGGLLGLFGGGGASKPLTGALQGAGGLSGWTTGPTPILAGESGREFVNITPESKMGKGTTGGQPIIYNDNRVNTTNYIDLIDAQGIENRVVGPVIRGMGKPKYHAAMKNIVRRNM